MIRAISILIIVSFFLTLACFALFINTYDEAWKASPDSLAGATKEQLVQMITEKQANLPPNPYLAPLLGSFGMAALATGYYIFRKTTEKKDEMVKHNAEIILRLLSTEERLVVRKLLDEGGKLAQIDIENIEGSTRLRAHRAVESLESKGIVHKAGPGKTSIVRIDKNFYYLLRN